MKSSRSRFTREYHENFYTTNSTTATVLISCWLYLLFLVVDVEGHMDRFVAKTLGVCSGLIILTYCTWRQRLLVLSLERSALITKINT